ncbi:hypothetical protein WR164_09790 [Philodulcilactobacillus myokoensis]|uniref:Uncharacterized protein n=1 Tax=Philodulcilactobacillus myokoensis TaxID=2929573 RepID=A0A9W6ESP3_9LACO|nr:hypothetical protein [Philodulcilactobacillus myokoensis]GLB47000.1 hypothetical protein WR164_09790 [Philodulcilactobacillus myokoensis]
MFLALEVALGLLIALFIYNLVHHFFVVVPSRKRLLKMKQNVDSSLKISIQHLNWQYHIIKSNELSDVWGRGILVFEYVIDFKENDNIKKIRTSLSNELKQFGTGYKYPKQFIITDAFKYNNYVHIDIAYLVNQSTLDYVKDINKLK